MGIAVGRRTKQGYSLDLTPLVSFWQGELIKLIFLTVAGIWLFLDMTVLITQGSYSYCQAAL